MLQKAVTYYYQLFDRKMKSSTAVVVLIACMICGVGASASGYDAQSYKANMFEVQATQEHRAELEIDGVRYQIVLSPLEK